jgi:hypothetical protein
MNMQMKFEIDEARILKLVMDGYTKKRIEEKLAEEIITSIKEETLEKFKAKARNLLNTDNLINNTFIKTLQKELAEVIKPSNLKKEFKKEEWSQLFSDIVEPTLINFLENMLSEWCTIAITVGNKKKRATIEVVGKDSYEYRKK